MTTGSIAPICTPKIGWMVVLFDKSRHLLVSMKDRRKVQIPSLPIENPVLFIFGFQFSLKPELESKQFDHYQIDHSVQVCTILDSVDTDILRKTHSYTGDEDYLTILRREQSRWKAASQLSSSTNPIPVSIENAENQDEIPKQALGKSQMLFQSSPSWASQLFAQVDVAKIHKFLHIPSRTPLSGCSLPSSGHSGQSRGSSSWVPLLQSRARIHVLQNSCEN